MTFQYCSSVCVSFTFLFICNVMPKIAASYIGCFRFNKKLPLPFEKKCNCFLCWRLYYLCYCFCLVPVCFFGSASRWAAVLIKAFMYSVF
ncbi:hypothetical protein HanRHA438_Chr02g0082631 [Helianthus annuus]|nr:hypothetical protein HanRHA438_Chr02g0082631 [Helianthus annuus]